MTKSNTKDIPADRTETLDNCLPEKNSIIKIFTIVLQNPVLVLDKAKDNAQLLQNCTLSANELKIHSRYLSHATYSVLTGCS